MSEKGGRSAGQQCVTMVGIHQALDHLNLMLVEKLLRKVKQLKPLKSKYTAYFCSYHWTDPESI